jgi:hypothetical protein
MYWHLSQDLPTTDRKPHVCSSGARHGWPLSVPGTDQQPQHLQQQSCGFSCRHVRRWRFRQILHDHCYCVHERSSAHRACLRGPATILSVLQQKASTLNTLQQNAFVLSMLQQNLDHPWWLMCDPKYAYMHGFLHTLHGLSFLARKHLVPHNSQGIP